MLTLGSTAQVRGFVTKEDFTRGQSLKDMERRLGSYKGRLAEGALFVLLLRYPKAYECELRGYSQVAGHR